jgi:hypothetical protein
MSLKLLNKTLGSQPILVSGGTTQFAEELLSALPHIACMLEIVRHWAVLAATTAVKET